jgi:hypothetical protein
MTRGSVAQMPGPTGRPLAVCPGSEYAVDETDNVEPGASDAGFGAGGSGELVLPPPCG